MNNYTMNAYEMKRDLINFSKKTEFQMKIHEYLNSKIINLDYLYG